MAQGLTLQQLQAMGATPSVQPTGQKGLSLEELKAMGAKPSDFKDAEPGILESTAKDIASKIARFGVSAFNIGTGIIPAIKGDVAGMNAEFTKERNLPYLGKIKPVASNDIFSSTGEVLKDNSGLAADLFALGAGGGATKNIASNALKQSIFKTGVQAAKTGILPGMAAGYGAAAQEKNSTTGDILKSTAMGGGFGAGFGFLGGIGGGTLSKTALGAKSAVSNVAGKVADATSGARKFVSDAGSVLKSKAQGVGRFAQELPERMDVAAKATKVAEKSLAAEKPIVQKAVQSGFSQREASTVANANLGEKRIFREMTNEAKKFTAGTSDKSSADVAGSYLQKRLNEADKIREEVGAKLGDAVKNIKGEVVASKVKVLARMEKVPGLQGIRLDNKGNLDFSNTTLSTALTKSERSQINSLYRAITGRDAFKLHQLRQEIFEILGGKQKAKVPLTDTQEKAFEAIRQGLADALETISPQYKKLNQQFAKVAEPMKNLRKFYRGLEDAGSDILDERSGVLLRRLTSNAPSAQNLKQAISQLDQILSENGKKSFIDLNKLQEFHNILEREYADIVKDTGFAGQTAVGLRKGAGTLFEKSMEVLGNVAGNTPDYRRKLLDDLLR